MQLFTGKVKTLDAIEVAVMVNLKCKFQQGQINLEIGQKDLFTVVPVLPLDFPVLHTAMLWT